MNKNFFIGFGLPIILGFLIIISIKPAKIDVNELSAQSVDKVQVFMFHSTARCIACVTMGELTRETVLEYFQPEIRDGKIEFKEINVDLPQNREVARRFQASGSSLFINEIINGQDNIVQDVNVWRLLNNETQFKNYLKNKINNILDK